MSNISAEDIKIMTSEYITREGYLTCESSISEDKLKELQPFLEEMNIKLLPLESKWKFGYCNICKNNDPSNPIHLEIFGIEERHPFDDGDKNNEV